MSNLYLIQGFNNYYNRRVKKYDTLIQYTNGKTYTPLNNTNFRYGDGIHSEHVFNYKNGIPSIPDYMLVCDTENNIESRWFVLEFEKNRGGQYVARLYRDVVADNLDTVMNAPTFVEKGTVSDPTDPAIFNSEDMTFNQIKTEETLLKDKTNCPWIVGYYSRNFDSSKQMKGPVYSNVLDEVYDEYIQTPIRNWKYFKYTNLSGEQMQKFKGAPFLYDKSTFIAAGPGQRPYFMIMYTTNSGDYGPSDSYHVQYPLIYKTDIWGKPLISDVFRQFQANYVSYGSSRLNEEIRSFYGYTSTADEDEFIKYNNKIVKDSEGRFFKITITKEEAVETRKAVPVNSSLFNTLRNLAVNKTGLYGDGGADTFSTNVKQLQYTMRLEEQKSLSTNYDLTADKLETTDTPYNIFAIPYGEVNVVYQASKPVLTTNATLGLETAMSIVQSNADIVYDVQLVPYCPVPGLIKPDGLMHCNNTKQYSLIQSGSTVSGIIFNVPSSNFTLDIELDKPIEITEPKIQNQCDMYRLCSPNWNGIFEFNAVKNGGVRTFNVDCTYKPFTPYIHVNPVFDELYGRDFDDARGLICGGDFSLPRTTDKWQQYMLNNKNFQQSFDRQIENMEVNNKYQRQADVVNAIGGTFQGAAGGAMFGAMTGGLGGAIAGGAAGGIASMAGGIADVGIKDALRAEAIDYTKDQFGYNLGNIQALPNTLNKVSAYNNNNKLFPVLEYYTCTEKEKQALRDKIKYNGMTIMRVGKLKDFIKDTDTYVKGKIILLDGIDDEFHMASTIANEINQGVRIYEYTR